MHCKATSTADTSCKAEHLKTTGAKPIFMRVSDQVITERYSPIVAQITERIGELIRPKEQGVRGDLIKGETTA